MKLKNQTLKNGSQPRRITIIFLILCSFLICLSVSPLTRTQSAAGDSRAQPKPTPPVLDEESASDLIDELTEILEEKLKNDERKVESITEKWEAAELVGRTRKQALDVLFPDVKRVISDINLRNEIWKSWNSEEVENEVEPADNPSEAGISSTPTRDMARFNSIKKVSLDNGKTWSFTTSAGPLKFSYGSSGGMAEFKPNNKVGNASVAWIQVVRTGGKDRWYASVADINAFTNNNQNFVLRTDAVYGFRVDKTKGENVPFWEQTNLKPADTLASYTLGSDWATGMAKAGGTMSFSDNPQPETALERMAAMDPSNDEYRFYFLLSPINTETGEIYGTVEWGILLRKTGPHQYVKMGLEPSLVKTAIPELKGRELAFDRWNTVFSKQYKSNVPWFGHVVYPIPGQRTFWGK